MRILLASVGAFLTCVMTAYTGFAQVQLPDDIAEDIAGTVTSEASQDRDVADEDSLVEPSVLNASLTVTTTADSSNPELCPVTDRVTTDQVSIGHAATDRTEASVTGLSESSLLAPTVPASTAQASMAEAPAAKAPAAEAIAPTPSSSTEASPDQHLADAPDCSQEATVRTPLQRPPVRLFNLETANQLSAGALLLSLGAHQTIPDASPGTGSQLYYGRIEQGITDDLQVGLSAQVYDDPPTQSINGESPNITLISLAPSLKYRLIETQQLSLALQGSIELLSLSSGLFDTSNGEGVRVVGSVHTPLTYTASPNLQFHLTPGVAFLPDSLKDNDLYGTLFTLGTGASWQPTDRWLAYGTLNLPIGPGGNTLERDQSIGLQPVWTLGTRYNVTPKTGIELYATNGLGVTPATETLTSIPGGDELLLGVALNYTPDTGLGYLSSFRTPPSTPLTARDRQLTADGITLTTANTLAPGNIAITASGGTDGNYSAGVAYSPDEALQLEAMVENFGSNSNIKDIADDALRYMLGARVQLLDQRRGDAVSVSARILGGRDLDSVRTTGVLFVDLPVTYQLSPRAALSFNPRAAAFAENVDLGLGFGVNYEVAQGWQLMGEVTPVFGGARTVWALGGRYSFPTTAVDLDLYVTNAAGRTGLGTLVGQSDAQVGAGLRWVLGQ